MGPRLRTCLWVFPALVTQMVAACAQGGGKDTVIHRGDASTAMRRDGAPAGDGGARAPDAGTDAGPMCVDDRAGATCAAALSVGPAVAVGTTLMGEPSVIPMAAGEDWYSVLFVPSAAPMTPGGGTPTIGFAMNEGDAFRLDVMTTCGTPATCGMGTPTALTSYSFTDDQSMPGMMAWSTRTAAWPMTLHVRVRRTTPGTSCARYVLQVSR